MRIKLESILLFTFASAVMGSGIGYSKIWLFHIALLTFFLSWVYLMLLGRTSLLGRPKSKFILFLLLFIGWYSLSVLWSIETLYALRYLGYLVIGFFLMILIASYATTEERYHETFRVLGVTFCVAIVIGLLEAFTSFRLPTSPFSEYSALFGRKVTDFSEFNETAVDYIKSMPTSFWGNPNNFAVAMAMIVPMFLMLRSKASKYIGLMAIVILVIMAGSRGALVALAFGLMACFLLLSYKKIAISLLALAIVIVFCYWGIENAKGSDIPRVAEIATIPDLLYRYVFESNDSTNSIGVRQQLIRNGMDAFWRSGGLGVGAGGSQVVQENLGGVNGKASMHNFWVEILVDGGLVGFFLFFAFFATLAFQLLCIARSERNQFYREHARSLFLSMVIFSVGCISASSVIYFLPMWILFGLAIALIGLWLANRGGGKLSIGGSVSVNG